MARHHYVSKFYYKNFASNPERSLVHSMNKGGIISSKLKSVKRISFEVDYNTSEQEQDQNRLETKYARVLRDFVKNPDPGHPALSRDLIDFVSFLMGNNIDTREKLDEGFSKMEFQIKDAPDDLNISIHRGHKGKYDWCTAIGN